MQRFERIGRSCTYWLALALAAVALEAIALYYQYALGRYPCVLCIHVRIWVAAFVPIGVAGLLLRHSRPGLAAASALSMIAAIGLAERSWQTLATERGWSLGSCSLDSGLPPWFALDQWVPILFKVHTPCGYTPELLFGVTMAEGLAVVSAAAIAATSLVSYAAVRGLTGAGEGAP